ncbi:hypothetical protein IAD21_02654 [Abditibacteriota bacterium]|nr:hypothetical protein IAD21_02654 [Abditibacteriota bacterium]
MQLFVIFASFFVAQIAQRIIVPILVQILGERRFASPSAFDGCTLGIVGALVAGFGMIFWDARNKAAAKYHQPVYSPLWILLIVAIGITLYGLIFLWVLGSNAKKHEWKIVNERILDGHEQQLHPTFIRERTDYTQTDAYNGYSQYFLELHNDSGLLGTNAYNSEAEFKRDMERVSELTNARRLDLIWAIRVESRKWMVAYFPNSWALFLCGTLDRLTDADRLWWHSWTYPNFAARIAVELDTHDALERLNRLQEAYGKEMGEENSNASEFPEKLRRILLSEGPVVALDRARFDEQVNEARGNIIMFWHEGDFAELRP